MEQMNDGVGHGLHGSRRPPGDGPSQPALGDRGLPKARITQNSRGQSLLLVLASLVLLSVLVLALLSAFSSEMSSSANYANGATVRELANSTVNLAMGLIATATSGQDSTGKKILDWASQPGMIRTYDTTGKPYSSYKLYSSPTLSASTATTGSGTFVVANEVSAMNNWWTMPAQFTDLNAQITDPVSGNTYYPILDPNAVYAINSGSSTTITGTGVEGFSFGRIADSVSGTQTTSFTGTLTTSYAAPAGPSSVNGGTYFGQMPVTWLYVLKNGQIIAPDTVTSTGTTITTATFANASTSPSTSNPIVGRIAFWTDDETSKVNINTASTGTFTANATVSGTYSSNPSTNPWTQTYWDTPRAETYAERTLGLFQPVGNEFQRYPGHPATTDLLTALPLSLSGTNSGALTPLNIYNITPRYNSGITSTANSSNTGSSGSQLAANSVSTVTGTMSLKYNRLYSTIDELMFAAPTVGGSITIRNTQGISESQLEQSRFFITANSRAPEVNVFNLPRISMWPISTTNDTAHRTTNDQTLAFCSTLNTSTTSGTTTTSGTFPYYFQRDPTSGLGTTSATGAASPTDDYANIPRNKSLYSYLQNLTGTFVPGFKGGTSGFASAAGITGYGTLERDQILTEMFDYIRCINIDDQGITTPANRYAPFTSASGSITASGGQVVPIQIPSSTGTTTMGFGRFALPYEVGIDFVCEGLGANTLKTTATGSVAVDSNQANTTSPAYTGGSGTGTIPGSGKMAVQAILVMSFICPAAGTPSYVPSFTVQISGMKTFALASATPALSCTPSGTEATYVNHGSTSGSLVEHTVFVANKLLGTGDVTKFPFYSNIVEVPYSSATNKLNFTGGTITISIFAGSGTSTTPVQTISNLTIPSGTFSMPVLPDPSLRGLGTGVAEATGVQDSAIADRFITGVDTINNTFFGWDFNDRYDPTKPSYNNFVSLGGTQNQSNINSAMDSLQTQVLTSGDGRLVFRNALDNSVLSLFSQSPVPSKGILYGSFVRFNGADNFGCYGGSIVPGLTPSNFSNIVPATLSGAYVNGGNASTYPLGDFDSGLPSIQDGPYINKPDEGDVNPSAVPYFPPGYTAYYPVNTTYFSPNRLVPSSGMFGSLSTGILDSPPAPWRTLLFHPDLIPIGSAHPGSGITAGSPSYNSGTSAETPTTGSPGVYSWLPDHLFMDLFWMPVIEPYPISEPFSTAGKVNMNYQIMPFAFINRETAIRAVLKYERPIAIPSTPSTKTDITYGNKDLNNLSSIGSQATPSGTTVTNANKSAAAYKTFAVDWRYKINLDQTLLGFRQRFAKGTDDLFRSASEICLIPLVPTYTSGDGTFNPANDTDLYDAGSKDPAFPLPATAMTYAQMFQSTVTGSSTFWPHHALTGDNLRERPYTNIYPRLTTKSNTYTVHYWVETLKQTPTDAAANKWVEGTDQITGEYRGSSVIERYLDPNATIPDYASYTSASTLFAAPPLSNYYKFRVLETKQYTP